MAQGKDFRIYMKAANRDQSNQYGPHLSEATMVAYYRNELPEAERDVTQAHLVVCAECIALFRSVSDFLEPAGADEVEIADAETDEQWQSFRQRVKISSPESVEKIEPVVVQGNFKQSRVKNFVRDSRPTLLLAASLLIIVGLTGVLGGSWLSERQSRREAQERTAQLESKQRELEQRLTQLTESGADQIKLEREKLLAVETERDKLQKELLAALNTSGIDAEKDVRFTISPDRGSTQELQLKLDTATRVSLLISKPGAFSQYKIEILDERGSILKKFSGVRPKGIESALTFRLNRHALSPGKYRLRISGQQKTSTTQIYENSLLINGPN